MKQRIFIIEKNLKYFSSFVVRMVHSPSAIISLMDIESKRNENAEKKMNSSCGSHFLVEYPQSFLFFFFKLLSVHHRHHIPFVDIIHSFVCSFRRIENKNQINHSRECGNVEIQMRNFCRFIVCA